MFSTVVLVIRRFSRSLFRRGSTTQNFGMAVGCRMSRRMARILPTRTEDKALQRCHLSAVPGAKTEGGRSSTAHLPAHSIRQPSGLAQCEKTFVAGCHDCDSTGCPRAQHIRVVNIRRRCGNSSKMQAKSIFPTGSANIYSVSAERRSRDHSPLGCGRSPR